MLSELKEFPIEMRVFGKNYTFCQRGKKKKKANLLHSIPISGGTSCLKILRQATFFPQLNSFLKIKQHK